jgi:hypothetical protein
VAKRASPAHVFAIIEYYGQKSSRFYKE